MQPLIKDANGIIRFKANTIVRYLIDVEPWLNRLAEMEFAEEDWIQFYQLIGYSVSGFNELSKIPDSVCAAVEEVIRVTGLASEPVGCRADNCEIHCRGSE